MFREIQSFCLDNVKWDHQSRGVEELQNWKRKDSNSQIPVFCPAR